MNKKELTIYFGFSAVTAMISFFYIFKTYLFPVNIPTTQIDLTIRMLALLSIMVAYMLFGYVVGIEKGIKQTELEQVKNG